MPGTDYICLHHRNITFRLCSLGSACDAFFVEDPGTGLQCTYLPHVALKNFELVDFVNYSKDDKDMYLLQCSQGADLIFKKGTMYNCFSSFRI